MKVIFSLPEFGDSRFKSWSKLVTGVDTAQQNGYAFDGQFIQSGRRHEAEVGALVLQLGHFGSRARNFPQAVVWRVEADGTLCEVATSQGSDWALMIRSTVAAALPQTAPNPLDQFSNDDLLAECRRRGINTNT